VRRAKSSGCAAAKTTSRPFTLVEGNHRPPRRAETNQVCRRSVQESPSHHRTRNSLSGSGYQPPGRGRAAERAMLPLWHPHSQAAQLPAFTPCPSIPAQATLPRVLYRQPRDRGLLLTRFSSHPGEVPAGDASSDGRDSFEHRADGRGIWHRRQLAGNRGCRRRKWKLDVTSATAARPRHGWRRSRPRRVRRPLPHTRRSFATDSARREGARPAGHRRPSRKNGACPSMAYGEVAGRQKLRQLHLADVVGRPTPS
jgi:hypothetical protein